MEVKAENILVEVSKEIAKETYNDAAKPIIKPTGQIAGLVPRAIKAALLPVEKWILGKEYNLEKTKKLLELKLEKINPELIESPEPYIAVPAIQYISYCMDSEELRDMYANLLANSMNKVVKNEVHPGFIEIIKQLSPDEAKILKKISIHKTIPVINVRYNNEKGEGVMVLNYFSDVGEKANCENPMEIASYFENMEKLGLIKVSEPYSSIVNKAIYEPLKNHKRIKELAQIPSGFGDLNKVEIIEGYFTITNFGEKFCKICIRD